MRVTSIYASLGPRLINVVSDSNSRVEDLKIPVIQSIGYAVLQSSASLIIEIVECTEIHSFQPVQNSIPIKQN